MSRLGRRLIQSANEALAVARGELEPARVYERADVAAIRKQLKLSQEKFAAKFRVSAATVRDWEQAAAPPTLAPTTTCR